jgi:hypothetical protein
MFGSGVEVHPLTLGPHDHDQLHGAVAAQNRCGVQVVNSRRHWFDGEVVLAEQLGAVAADPGPVVVDALELDQAFHTSALGLSAAGDLSGQMPSVANAVAAGSSAAAMIVHDLALEAPALRGL